MTERDCKHGHLARSCEMCETEARLQAADALASAADLFSAAVFAEDEDHVCEHGAALDRAISAYRSRLPSTTESAVPQRSRGANRQASGAADMAEGERARPVLNHWSPPGHTVRSLCGAAEPSTTFATVFADVTCKECYARAAAPSPGPRVGECPHKGRVSRDMPCPDCAADFAAASSGKREHDFCPVGTEPFCLGCKKHWSECLPGDACLRVYDSVNSGPGGAERAEPGQAKHRRWCAIHGPSQVCNCGAPRGGKGSSDG